METVAESGKGKWSPISKHQIQPGCGERAGWRGTGRPNLTRDTKLSGANGDRENSVFPVQLTTSRIGNHTWLRPSLLKVMTTYTRIHTHSVHCRSVIISPLLSSNRYTHNNSLSLATDYQVSDYVSRNNSVKGHRVNFRPCRADEKD